MQKNIDFLIPDIHKTLEDGVDKIPEEHFQSLMKSIKFNIEKQILQKENTGTKAPTRLSSLGEPCTLKQWYTYRGTGEKLSASVRLKFLYGDIIESLLLFLCKVSGHEVTSEQEEVTVNKTKGHLDSVIDGRVVDVKSASSYSFKKFREHRLPEDDPFNYLVQGNSYLFAKKHSPEVKDKDLFSFLVMDKTLGHLTLDTYADSGKDFNQLSEDVTKVVLSDVPPKRYHSDVPEGKSGNRKLGVACSYCSFKKQCWPNMRTFLYSTGPVFLTHVAKEPKVAEIFDDNDSQQEG